MNKEFIDFLKAKVSIVDVVSKRVRLRKSGRDWFGLCPFHREKTASFKVDVNRGFYHCFGCGAGGDIISFVQNFDKVSFSEAVERIANAHGIPLPRKEKFLADPNKPVYDALGEMKNWFSRQLNGSAGENARRYLESRKISPESVEKFQLGFAPNDQELFKHLRRQGFSEDVLMKTGGFLRSKFHGELTGRYNGRLIFPILNGLGKCVGFGGRILDKTDAAKYINSPETEVFIKGEHLYGYFLAKRGNTRKIILTEGYMDVISMHQAGFDGAVAPMGTSLSETQINMCWSVCNNPLVSLDGDSAGIKASYRWLDKILSFIKAGRSFDFVKLPQGSDPDQLIANGQSAVVREAVENAIPLCEWLWDGAFLLYPSETPEQKAALIKMLMEKIETIADNSVKKLYRQTIKQKERDLYRQKFTPRILIKKENIRPIMSVRGKLEKIFVVTIINHPYIMDRVIESFVRLEFNDSKMKNLKNRLLDSYDNYLNGNVGKYVAEVTALKNEHEEEIKDVELHAKFAATEVSDEEAVEAWLSLADKYLAEHVMVADLQNAASSLKSTFSENDWQRLKALKHEVISGRTKKQEM